MRPVITWLSILLLLFSSGVAFYSGYHLFGHPDGGRIGLSTDILKNIPFNNFKIPGILFFISIGITGAVIIILTLYQHQHHSKFIYYRGILLVMWILLLIALSPEITHMHYALLFTGIGEVLCGLWLEKKIAEAA